MYIEDLKDILKSPEYKTQYAVVFDTNINKDIDDGPIDCVVNHNLYRELINIETIDDKVCLVVK